MAKTAKSDAVFLSGNGPLVKVLQYALKSTVFVQDVHGFLRDYGGTSSRLPRERIWVYDEAQRAWDSKRVQEKRGHEYSEPEDFIRLGERVTDWALIVGLIGEGQEIHLGEESGLGQWNDAIANSRLPWIVHCPTRLASTFPSAQSIHANDAST
ncbi:MAG: DNA/RNA helicase domain-containing protein [Thermomicrobiales bacterium]